MAKGSASQKPHKNYETPFSYLKLLTHEILGDMTNYVIACADDITIATDETMAHHIDVVTEVLLKL